jgi:hypothetical protein
MKPSTTTKDEEEDTAIDQMYFDLFGNDWEEVEITHLSTSERIGLELF